MTLDPEAARGQARARLLFSRGFPIVIALSAVLLTILVLQGLDPETARATLELAG